MGPLIRTLQIIIILNLNFVIMCILIMYAEYLTFAPYHLDFYKVPKICHILWYVSYPLCALWHLKF